MLRRECSAQAAGLQMHHCGPEPMIMLQSLLGAQERGEAGEQQVQGQQGLPGPVLGPREASNICLLHAVPAAEHSWTCRSCIADCMFAHA